MGTIVLYLPYVNCYSTSEVRDCGVIVLYSSYFNYYLTSGVQDCGSNSFICQTVNIICLREWGTAEQRCTNVLTPGAREQ